MSQLRDVYSTSEVDSSGATTQPTAAKNDDTHRFTISDYLDQAQALGVNNDGPAAPSPSSSSSPTTSGPIARVQAGPSRPPRPDADLDIEAISSPPTSRQHFPLPPTSSTSTTRAQQTPLRTPPRQAHDVLGGLTSSGSGVLPPVVSRSTPPSSSSSQPLPPTTSPKSLTPPRLLRKPVRDPLGVMISPLGPGPEPYPNSPDGNASDISDSRTSQDVYVPQLTYPPQSRYPGYSDSRPAYMGGNNRPSPPRGPVAGHSTTSPTRPGMSMNQNQQSAFARQQTHQLPPGAAASGPPMTIDGALMSPTTQGVLSDDEDDDDDEKHAAPPLPEKSRNSVAAVPPAPVKLSRGDKAGVQLRKLIPASLACRLLLLTVFLEAVIDIAIQANILWRFQLEVDSAEESSDTTSSALEANKRRLPVYLYIFVTAHIVQLGLTVYAIRTRNTIQVIGLAIFNGLFVIYAGIEIEEIRNILGNTTPAANAQTTHNLLTLPLNVLTAIVIAVVAASEIAVVVLTWFIWREFGWRIYRFLGADLRIRRFYLQYQIFECICCFSFFFFAGFGVQFALLVLNNSDPEYIITWIMFPVLLVWLGLGVIAARRELMWGMVAFVTGLLCGTAYFIYKLVRIWTDRAKYSMVAKSLTAFGCLSLVMIILCTVYGSIVWHNFGRGLKEHVADKKKDKKEEKNQMMALSPQYNAGGFGGLGHAPTRQHHRLTID